MTSRRTFLATFAGGILAVPLAADAQRARKIYRLGLLFNVLPPTFPDRWAFYERIRQLGWVYNQTFAAEHRVYGEQYERIPELAAELIRAGVDIFVVQGGIDAARVQQATRTIPMSWFPSRRGRNPARKKQRKRRRRPRGSRRTTRSRARPSRKNWAAAHSPTIFSTCCAAR